MMKKLPQIIVAILVVGAAVFFYQKSLDKKSEPEAPKSKMVQVETPVDTHEAETKEVAEEGVPAEKEEHVKAEEEIKDTTEDTKKVKLVKVVNLKETVPAGAILYLNFTDLKGVYKDNIEQSNFFNKFVALKVFDDLRKDIDKFNKESVFKISFDNILNVLGNDLFMSIYVDENSEEPLVLLSTTLDDSLSYIAKVFSFITQMTVKGNAKTDVGKETYKGVDVSYVRDKKKSEGAYYMILGQSAHLANNIDTLKKVIDLHKGDSKNSLSNSADYNAVAKNFRDTHFFSMLFDFKVFGSVQDVMNKKYGKGNPAYANAFKGIAAYDYMYGDAVVSKGIDAIFGMDIKNNNNEYVKFMDNVFDKPAKSAFLNNVKSSMLAYGADCGMSFTDYYNYLMDEFAKVQALTPAPPNMPPGQKQPTPRESFEQGFKMTTSLSFSDDVLTQLGDEFVYGFNGFDTSTPMFPIPKIFFGFKVKDADAFQKILDTINGSLQAMMKGQGMGLKHEEYNGYKLSSAPTPFGVLPGHGLVDDFYLIYSVPSSLMSIIDEIGSKDKPFFSTDDQKVFTEYLDSEYHGFIYFDSKKFLQTIPDLFDRYSNILQGQMSSDKRKESLRKYNEEVLPLIETLKVFDRGASTVSYDEKNKKFFIKSYFLMKDIE